MPSLSEELRIAPILMLKVGVKYSLSLTFISLKFLMNEKSNGRLSASVRKQNSTLINKQRGVVSDHFTDY